MAYLSVTIVGVLVVYLFLRGAVTGFPLLSGADRFAYRAAADVIVINVLTLKYVIAGFMGAGAALAAERRCRFAHQAVFVAYLAVTFLFADKFFNILIAAIIFSAPAFMLGVHSGGRALLRLLPGAVLSTSIRVAASCLRHRPPNACWAGRLARDSCGMWRCESMATGCALMPRRRPRRSAA